MFRGIARTALEARSPLLVGRLEFILHLHAVLMVLLENVRLRHGLMLAELGQLKQEVLVQALGGWRAKDFSMNTD